MIAAIDTVDGSTLGDNLITSHQVDYMSSALIPVEAVENDQYFVKTLTLKSLWRRTSICIWLHLFDLVIKLPWCSYDWKSKHTSSYTYE